MIDQEFLVAWVIYLVASLSFLMVWWLLTSKLPSRWLRMFLRMPAIAILLTPLHMPIHNMPSDYVYTPAVAAFGIDLVAGHSHQAMYILPYLLTSIGVSLLFGGLYLYCFPGKRHRSKM